MRNCCRALLTGYWLAGSLVVSGQKAFTVVPLGVKGGLDESNLSAYMAAAAGSADYICLDAGTLYTGIRKAVAAGVFSSSISQVLKDSIKAYFISHGHLDHVAGLVLNSPEDSTKPIYAMPYCLDVLKEKYFTWESWANFADEGEKPVLKKYHYMPLTEGAEISVPGTPLQVKAFSLSHGAPYQSTAFLVRHEEDYLLYLGDTGADTVEHSDKLHRLWETVGPLIRGKKLKGIFIEVSFPDEQPEKQLFGHLTPRLLMEEMSNLEKIAGEHSLQRFPIIITHRKPSGRQEAAIRGELEKHNPLGLRLIFPEQAKRLEL